MEHDILKPKPLEKIAFHAVLPATPNCCHDSMLEAADHAHIYVRLIGTAVYTKSLMRGLTRAQYVI